MDCLLQVMEGTFAKYSVKYFYRCVSVSGQLLYYIEMLAACVIDVASTIQDVRYGLVSRE
jgi:hypothetical protein